MARRPLVALLVALLLCAAAATGFVRFGIDAGQSLLVGSRSASGEANQSFTQSFGTDPIVVVLSAATHNGATENPGNPTAPYLEANLQRLAALEDDLAHDPRVAEVLGPGSVAHSALSATTEEITRTLGDSQTLGEYPYFVAETDLLVARQHGQTDATKLRAQFQSDITNARNLLELYVARAASDAHQARAAYAQKAIPPQDRIIDGEERAADAAVAKDPLPPLFAEYLAGPGNTADTTVARDFFDRLTSAFGDCDGDIAALLQITPSCQVYLDRILLDLPTCPTQAQVQSAQAIGTEMFCSPKSEWSAVLPPPATVTSNGQHKLLAREVITVRLTKDAAASRSAVLAIRQKISDELTKGIADDAYTRTFNGSQLQQLKQLGPLDPSECAGAGQQNSPACYSSFSDRPFDFVIAGAPLLTYGVVDSMTETLLILLPVVAVLMAILLLATFRVRGRLWPLLAAAGAGAATIGVSLWLGVPVTPAVLAGIPVLVGLAVDYAVQLVARYDEERGRGAGREEALAQAMGRSGPATLTAALATLAGLGTLMLFAGVDAGPFVAIPLVAEFALVLFVGVILAWLAAMFIALPAAVLREREAGPVGSPPPPPTPQRTLGLATYWRGAVIPAVIAALVGWVLLVHVPVQTQVDQLLASSLPQLTDINTVRDQTGYGNEIDIYLQGQVAGPYNQPGTPANVQWQCSASEAIRSVHADQVALAISIADFFIATSSSTSASTNAPCVAPSNTAPAPAPSPSPSPGSSSSPSSTPSASPAASPTRARSGPPKVYLAASGPASPTATAAPASPSASATPSPAPAQQKTQTAFLCDLRLLPSLARNLVQEIPLPPSSTSSKGTLACPAIDKYLNSWLTADTSPIDPSSARIVIGVQSTSIADEARLIDSIRANEISAPPSGIVATPVGIAALAAQAYDTIVSRSLVLNLLPLVVVFLALLLLERDFRRAALPILPTAIAAGWAPLILLLLGLLPGTVGKTLGSFNPLTVVLGALVIALATEFGVVLLRRFDEEMARGVHPDDAAAAALAATGRAIRVSALTLGAGFAVLAVSALLPGGLPLLGAFGFTVLIDLGLAVAAVFGIMLPVAVAIERSRYEPAPAVVAPAPRAVAAPVTRTTPPAADAAEPTSPAVVEEPAPVPAPSTAADTAGPAGARRRGVSGRRRPPAADAKKPDKGPAAPGPRRPGVSGRRRRGPGPGSGSGDG
ncbi:MAG TPA: MMPL family transporter [Candidatus Dormibacteraeota bacterium]|nr:MMPL family transporter [Candidatus Dormibacteraeota bacterium]